MILKITKLEKILILFRFLFFFLAYKSNIKYFITFFRLNLKNNKLLYYKKNLELIKKVKFSKNFQPLSNVCLIPAFENSISPLYEYNLINSLISNNFRVNILSSNHYEQIQSYQHLNLNTFNYRSFYRISDFIKVLKFFIYLDFINLNKFKYNNYNTKSSILSTFFRLKRSPTINLKNKFDRNLLAKISLNIIENIISKFNPKILIFYSHKGYIPFAEFLLVCKNKNIQIINWSVGPLNNSYIFKYYDKTNFKEHLSSISKKTWNENNFNTKLINKYWLKDKKTLENSYYRKKWFPQNANTFYGKKNSKIKILEKLNILPTNKNVIIFPHIFYDASFFYGKDLFQNYKDWLKYIVTYAKNDQRFNWIFRVHPSNNFKNNIEGDNVDNEINLISDICSGIPSNFRVLPSNSSILTIDLFKIASAILTVRGTAGIEASALGIPVLTCGTGYYDKFNFTINSNSINEYKKNLDDLHKIKLSFKEITQARKFFHIWLNKNLFISSSIKFNYSKDLNAKLEVKKFDNRSNVFEFESNKLSKWISSGKGNYINYDYK